MLPSSDRFQRPGTFHAFIYFLIALCLALPGAWAGGCGGSSSNPATSQVSTGSRDNTDIPATTDTTAAAHVIFHAADGHSAELTVEVARTGAEKTRGLMQRDHLDADRGMIFIWDSPVQGGFWMKDTYIPLSIAFISEAGAVVDIQDMQPLDLASRVPSAKYIYAVEANQGWFTEHGIKVGDRAEFLER